MNDKADIASWKHFLSMRVALSIALLLAVVVPVAYWLWDRSISAAELLRQANAALDRGDAATAERLASMALSRQGGDPRAALLAARAAVKEHHFEAALGYYDRIPDDGSKLAVAARCESGDILLIDLKQASAAESQYRRAFKQHEMDPRANNGLSRILGITARSRAAVPFRLRLIRLDSFEPLHLYLMCMGDSVMENLDLLQQLRQSTPDDPIVLLGVARNAVDQQDYRQAIDLLQKVVAARPDSIAAQLKLGKLLLDHGEHREFLKWHAAVPQAAKANVEFWFILGRSAERHNQPDAAMRCLWEAARLDPTHEAAHFQLSQLLIKSGDTQLAQPFLERSRQLAEYFNTVKIAWVGKDHNAVRDAAELAESLGLVWEAYGWARLAQKHLTVAQWAPGTVIRLRGNLKQLESDGLLKFERTIDSGNIAATLDLSHLPLPQFSTGGSDLLVQQTDHRNPAQSQTRFLDHAAAVGIRFQYNNGSNPEMPGHRMFEFTGGGVAILDYDGDGWADIYLTQGCDWPPQERQTTHLDRLYRNQGDGTFADTTASAAIVENGFSQGASVGDYNNDGFPDLYVANIGGNRFYENNGDGTFTDVTARTETGGSDWSTSCVIADLDRDSNPDLYSVNYLGGDDVFERVCPDAEGIMRSCPPRNFPAAPDELWTNLGDGRFEDTTFRSGIVAENGRGLGIVAGDFDQTGRINLFVANDAVPNFYFVNSATAGSPGARFTEQGLALGLALNEDGGPEGCMGVAAGDADQDGLLDLFVSNFYNESNTLFLQSESHLFTDSTRQFGFHTPTLKMLGFGTQFVDGNLDGKQDLIVANGDVDDNRDIGRAYRMPPQYFENVGNGKFVELPSTNLGPYFQGKYLGRGLARVDWNRDGLDDIVISHLDAPAALLTNTTADAGNFVAVRLVGVQSSRDAIGTTLTAKVGDEKLMRQLTAGDGYQASNERRIIFGLGEHGMIDSLQVRWPSGKTQQFSKLTSGSELLLIEGRLPMQLLPVSLH